MSKNVTEFMCTDEYSTLYGQPYRAIYTSDSYTINADATNR